MPRSPKYSEQELLDEIRRLAEEVDRYPPTKRQMDERGNHVGALYQYRFGTWSRAVEAAGFSPRPKGEDFEERPDECPACGNRKTGLDFHHWRYGEDQKGCYLCRECHDVVHSGKGRIANTDWLPHAIENLVELHLNHHGPTDADEIVERYNMTRVTPLVERRLEELTD